MKLRVSLYSYFRELAGCAEFEQIVPDGSTLGALLDAVITRFPALASFRSSTLCAVGLEYQQHDYILKSGDEVAFFPPVQGG